MYTSFSEQVWKPRTSVKLRFALVQGFFIALIIGLLAATLYLTVRPRLVTTIDNSYKVLVNNLATSVFTTFQEGDRQGVVNAMRKVEGQQGVSYLLLTDGSNTVYYDSRVGDRNLANTVYDDALTRQLAETRDIAVGKVTRDGQDYYMYAYPFVAENEIQYTIRLAVAEDVIDGEFNRLARLFLSMAIFGTLLGILATYFLMSRLTRPVVALTESALAIRAGNLNAYADIKTNDELEQLSREFQGMVEKLKQFYFQEYQQKKEALDSKRRLEEINSRLAELDHQKTDFLNAASHQLRTPLSVIHWSISLIVEEASHIGLPEKQRELLEEALKSTKHMVDLVNDLLDLSRIEQGRKELEWELGNYGRVCEDLVKSLRPLAEKKNLELSYSQEGEVPDSFLDPKSFYEVVNNFVDNSIKYTEQGYVRVHVEKKDDTIVITVTDTGIGMNEEEKAKLFSRFTRGKEASKMFANGSGLGMYVAQAILRQHGGTIEVQSEKGKGTTFTLTMPIYAEAPTSISLGIQDDEYAQVGATTSEQLPQRPDGQPDSSSAQK